MARGTVACVVGTRPEAVKLAPIVLRLQRPDSPLAVRIIATGQQRELAAAALAEFGLRPNLDLALMRPDQRPADLLGRMVPALAEVLREWRPACVLAQGDTTTVLASALAAYYERVRFGHVEAGLRTGDLAAPFPEEGHRAIAARVARWNFAPTAQAAENLRAESIPDDRIHVTGNTVVDALLAVLAGEPRPPFETPTREYVLVTVHRRESFGEPLGRMLEAVRTLVDRNPGISVVLPVHPNPNVRGPVERALSGHDRIRLCEPLDYPAFAALMKGCRLILTDSGGVQEEAPALGRPVLILRERTERTEAVSAGCARLVGTQTDRIVAEAERLMRDPVECDRMSRVANPFGDGHAAERIVGILQQALSAEA